MAIIRGTLPEDNFTLVSNDWLRDTRISYKEKGILCAIASHRASYELTVEQLIAQTKDGRDAVYSGLKGLVDAGYLVVERRRDDRGRMGETDYRLVDPPPLSDASISGKSRSGKPRSGSSTSGQAQSGESDTKKTTHQEDQGLEDDSVPPSEERPAPDDANDFPVQSALVGEDKPLTREPSSRDRAMGAARSWITLWEDAGIPVTPPGKNASPLHAVANLLTKAFDQGFTEVEAKNALIWAGSSFPEPATWRRGLERSRTGWRAPRDWKPDWSVEQIRSAGYRSGGRRGDNGPMAGTNLHIDDLSAEERAARVPQPAARSSDVLRRAGVLA